MLKGWQGFWRRTAEDVESGDEYSIVRGLEPAFSNRAFFAYFFPFSLVAAVAALIKDAEWKYFALVVFLWVIGGALFAAVLAFRWWRKAVAAQRQYGVVKKSRQQLGKQLADRYRGDPNFFVVNDWNEEVKVNESGDADVVRRVRLTIGPEETRVLWTARESNGECDHSKVQVVAHQIMGNGQRAPMQIDVVWDDNGRRHVVHMYTNGDLAPHSTASIEIRWVWPGLFRGLLADGQAEDLNFHFTRVCANFRILYKFQSRRAHEFTLTSRGGSMGYTATTPKVRRYDTVQIEAQNLAANSNLRAKIVRTTK